MINKIFLTAKASKEMIEKMKKRAEKGSLM